MTRRRPSVAIAATSMPSSEVPLIRPSAFRRFVLDDRAMSPDTPAARSAFLTVATERGFIHQCTDFAALDARLAKGPVTAYVGYDCTADSLHIGNLMSIMLLRWFQKTGNKPIGSMDCATSRSCSMSAGISPSTAC